MNATNNKNVVSQDVNCNNSVNVSYPTARVVPGILGFLALCTIAPNYAVNAVKQITAGEEVSPSTTRPYGCSVKYKKTSP